MVGDREMESGTVAVRTRKGEDLGSMSIDDFASLLQADIAQRGRFVLEN